MVQVAYFDNAEVEFFEEEEATPRQLAAVKAVLTLTSADRLKDSRHVYAYYQDYREAVGGEDWMDEEMGVPETPEQIWDYVYPTTIGVWSGHEGDDHVYVFIESNCGWDEEHGLLLVWRDGIQLNKVGGFDGHPTNTVKEGEADDKVYSSSNEQYTTRL
nr:hypothetical protein [uncultured Devosia sp.]